MENKNCLLCQQSIKGRSDKKFCDDACRSQYYHKKNGVTSNQMRVINHTLQRNRRILKEQLGNAKTEAKVKRELLIEAGFNFSYFTHMKKHVQKGLAYVCYDYAYLPSDSDHLLLIRIGNQH